MKSLNKDNRPQKLPKSWGIYLSIVMMGLTAFAVFSINTVDGYRREPLLQGYNGWVIGVGAGGGGGGGSTDRDEGDRNCDVEKSASPVTFKNGDTVKFTLEITCEEDRDLLIVNDSIGSSNRGYLTGSKGGQLRFEDDSMKVKNVDDYIGSIDRSSGVKLEDIKKDDEIAITYQAIASDENVKADEISIFENKVKLSSGNTDTVKITLRGKDVLIEDNDTGYSDCSHSAANRFTDITKTHWADCYISQLVDLGIVWGYEDKTYRPDNKITRAEITKIALLMNGIQPINNGINEVFHDVAEDKWYAPYINSAYKNHIVDGYDDGTFRPDDFVTRAEAVKILLRSAGVGTADIYDVIYPDVKPSDWYYPYVAYATQNEIVNGFVDGTFGPDMHITRAEAAKIAANTKNVGVL